MSGLAIGLGAGLWVLTMAISVAGGYWVTGAVLSAARVRPPLAPPPRVPVLNAPAAPQEVMRGGALIGVLERTVITASILAGQVALVAIVLAVKGLGRYPELKAAPAASERFIIGTLTSVGVAVLIGFLGRFLLPLVFLLG